MNERTDIERIIERWFDDGPSRMPDRVAVVVAERIDRQRQRRAWRLPWRFPTMSTPLKLIIVGAGLLVVILGGAIFVGGAGGPVQPAPPAPTATPSPSPIASATPTTAPSASAAFPQWFTPGVGDGGVGILASGSQTSRSFQPAFTFSVPEGWVNDVDAAGIYGMFPDTPANQAAFADSGAIAHGIFMGYPPDGSPYFVCDAWEDHQGTAAEIVADIVATEALTTSEPIDVTIGGLTGSQVDVGLNPDWTDSCPDDPPGTEPWDGRTRGILLDVPGRGVIVIFVGADDEAFLADAMPIIESFQFDLGPVASPS